MFNDRDINFEMSAIFKKRRRRIRIIKIKIIIRNGAKTISLPNFAWET
jgi:hypothetical protein